MPALNDEAHVSAEALEKYLRRRAEEVILCREALAKQDWPTIERVGHKMKGNAETFGVPELAGVGNRLEVAAAAKQPEAVAAALQEFETVTATFKLD